MDYTTTNILKVGFNDDSTSCMRSTFGVGGLMKFPFKMYKAVDVSGITWEGTKYLDMYRNSDGAWLDDIIHNSVNGSGYTG